MLRRKNYFLLRNRAIAQRVDITASAIPKPGDFMGVAVGSGSVVTVAGDSVVIVPPAVVTGMVVATVEGVATGFVVAMVVIFVVTVVTAVVGFVTYPELPISGFRSWLRRLTLLLMDFPACP
jgi:hypothetical protein